MVSHIEWSPDGSLILVGVEKRGLAFAKSVHDPEWTCRIDEGLAGLVHCLWAPTSRHILTVSEFRLRLTVWSVIDQSAQYISCPKQDSTGIDFSTDGKLMAVAIKGDSATASLTDKAVSDVIGLFRVSVDQKWECLFRFSAETTDLFDLKFARDNEHLIAWDGPFNANI